MATLEMIEKAMAMPWVGVEPGEEEEEEMPLEEDEFIEPAGSVGWRDVCKSHVALDRNWRFGRCRERYLTPPGNSVWRIKVDTANNTLMASDRTGESQSLSLDALRDIRDARGMLTPEQAGSRSLI